MTKYTLCLIAAITFSNPVLSSTIENQADQEIEKLYQKLPKNMPFTQKLEKISAKFKNRPYTLGPLGEGKTGLFDIDPLYRTDRFDCTTYVSTVLALANSNNLKEFKKLIIAIRYNKNTISYVQRNHFMTVDWNIANKNKGYIKDITHLIKDKEGRAIAQKATAYFNKREWYKHTKAKQLRLANTAKTRKKLTKLYETTKNIPSNYGSLNYLPLSKLFNHEKEPNEFLFKQIPTNTIIEIVRPNWDLKNKIGTNINVSHLGFGIRKNGILYFREASTSQKKVIDTKLTEYLKKYLTNSTVKGINVQQILPPQEKS